MSQSQNNGALCPSCKTFNSYTSVFCGKCGQKLPWANAVQGVVPSSVSIKSTAKRSVWSWIKIGCLGYVGAMIVIGLVVSSFDKQKKDSSDQIQQAKSDAYHKTPQYRAQVEAESQKKKLAAAQDKERAKREAQIASQEVQSRAATMATVVKNVVNNTDAGSLINGMSVDPATTVNFTTSSTWDNMPYRSRLQLAQTLFDLWGGICTKKGQEKPYTAMHIVDATGNTVGGWDALSGVWVVDQ